MIEYSYQFLYSEGERRLMVTLEEAKVTLEEVLPSSLCRIKKVRDNAELTSNEIAILYQIVLDCENSISSYTWEELCIELDKISTIYIRFNNVETNKVKVVNPKKSDEIPASPNAIPWLVKQVLFYIYIYCIKHDVKMIKTRHYKRNNVVHTKEVYARVGTDNILDYLKKEKRIKISHNFFSRTKSSARNLYDTKEYKQPELPCNYMGQKRDQLAFAISNLVNQAGRHNVFVDIFGGSGAATVAFKHRNNCEYVYNEKNRMVHNLFKVLASKKDSSALIDIIKTFRKACLVGSINWIANDEVEITTSVDFLGLTNSSFLSITDSYFNKIKKKQQTAQNIYIPALNNAIIIDDNAKFEYICDFLGELLDANNDKIIEKGVLYDELHKSIKKDKISLKNDLIDLLFKPYRRDLLEINDEKGLDVFINSLNQDDKVYFCTVFKDNLSIFMLYEYECFVRVSMQYNITYAGIKGSISDFILARWRFNLLSYLFYFKEINSANISANKIVMALAELTSHELYKVLSDTFSNSIAYNFGRKRKNDGEPKSRDRVYDSKFFNKDYHQYILEFHELVKNVIIERMDCVNVIKKYSSKNYMAKLCRKSEENRDLSKEENREQHLFYSDSPYSGTADYEDIPNGVKKFTAIRMKKLINALVNSGDKFIFSMRANIKDFNSDKKLDYGISKEDAYRDTYINNKKIGQETLSVFIDHWKYGNGVDDATQIKKNTSVQYNEFYVLYIPTDKTKGNGNKRYLTLDESIRMHGNTEIMITNYPISSFSHKSGLRYEVYTFADFLRILGNNINLEANDVENKLDVELEKIKQSKK